jgi:uncharacterized membrane protein
MQEHLTRVLPHPVLPAWPIATLFFVVSLTPSLVPRDTEVQAILSGISLAAGYAVALLSASVWHRLQLPILGPHVAMRLRIGLAVVCLVIAAVTLWLSSDWQNGLRVLLAMPPVETARPFSIAGGAVAVFLVLLWLERLSRWLVKRLAAGFGFCTYNMPVMRWCFSIPVPHGAGQHGWSFRVGRMCRRCFIGCLS